MLECLVWIIIYAIIGIIVLYIGETLLGLLVPLPPPVPLLLRLLLALVILLYLLQCVGLLPAAHWRLPR